MNRKLIALALVGWAGMLGAASSADDLAIRDRLKTYADARNRLDAHAEALCYTEDGDFLALAGRPVKGRAEIEKALAVSVSGYHFALTVESVRFIGPKAAIAEASVIAGPLAHTINLLGTYVMEKRNGAWLITAARIARENP